MPQSLDPAGKISKRGRGWRSGIAIVASLENVAPTEILYENFNINQLAQNEGGSFSGTNNMICNFKIKEKEQEFPSWLSGN